VWILKNLSIRYVQTRSVVKRDGEREGEGEYRRRRDRQAGRRWRQLSEVRYLGTSGTERPCNGHITSWHTITHASCLAFYRMRNSSRDHPMWSHYTGLHVNRQSPAVASAFNRRKEKPLKFRTRKNVTDAYNLPLVRPCSPRYMLLYRTTWLSRPKEDHIDCRCPFYPPPNLSAESM